MNHLRSYLIILMLACMSTNVSIGNEAGQQETLKSSAFLSRNVKFDDSAMLIYTITILLMELGQSDESPADIKAFATAVQQELDARNLVLNLGSDDAIYMDQIYNNAKATFTTIQQIPCTTLHSLITRHLDAATVEQLQQMTNTLMGELIIYLLVLRKFVVLRKFGFLT